jgi:hypothetical protein
MEATMKPIMEPEMVPRTTLTGMNHLKDGKEYDDLYKD